jgi:hypothetical protein
MYKVGNTIKVKQNLYKLSKEWDEVWFRSGWFICE